MSHLTQNEIQSPYLGLGEGLPPNLSSKWDYFNSERGLKSNYARVTGVNCGCPEQTRTQRHVTSRSCVNYPPPLLCRLMFHQCPPLSTLTQLQPHLPTEYFSNITSMPQLPGMFFPEISELSSSFQLNPGLYSNHIYSGDLSGLLKIASFYARSLSLSCPAFFFLYNPYYILT